MTHTMATHDTGARIATLEKEIQSLSKEIQDEASRKRLSEVLTQGAKVLEPPVEAIWKIIMSVRLKPHKTSIMYQCLHQS